MNDFLHNLRTAKDRRYDRGRKPFDNTAQHPFKRSRNAETRKGNYRKNGTGDQLAALLNETLPDFKNRMDEIAESQKRMAQAAERRAEAEERKARALEAIAGYVEQLLPSTGQQATVAVPPAEGQARVTGPIDADVPAEAPPAELVVPSDKQQALKLIESMRAEGESYARIAEHLEAKGIPTPSGRGQWRGPAVSKLLREESALLN